MRFRQRDLFPLLICSLGIAIMLVTWWRAKEDQRTQLTAGLSAFAGESRVAIQRRVEQHVSALRNVAKFWQLHGLLPEGAWLFHSRMILQHFPGISHIAWVNRNGEDLRFASLDTTATLPEALHQEALQRIAEPSREYDAPGGDQDALHVFLPIRTPEDSVGVLTAAIRSDSLFGGASFETARGLAYLVLGPDGRTIFRQGTPDPDAPPWLAVRSDFPLSTGETWSVVYRPTEAYPATTVSPWPNYFLWAGLLLSLALGAVAFQFLRLRDFSAALSATNRALDAQVRELSEAQAKLRRLNEELESRVETRTSELSEALRELEAFSHSVSHDLRSPIGAVMNFASILEEDYGQRLDEEGRRMLQRIRGSGEAATRLLNELVQLSWAGREEPERRTVDMTETARTAFAEAIAGDGQGEGAELALAPLPPACADPALVERVFTNLFANALKYSRGREPRRIEVRGELGPRENVYVVADNGVGFEPDLAEVLFEPFRRMHPAKDFPGTGLGLAIVAKIVRRHGGRVWAESDGANGARFYFTLPVSREEA